MGNHAPLFARAGKAAQHFGIGESTLWEWAKRPGFPKPVKMGGRTTLFDLASVARFIAENDAGEDPKAAAKKRALDAGRDKFNAAKRATAPGEGRRAAAAVSA